MNFIQKKEEQKVNEDIPEIVEETEPEIEKKNPSFTNSTNNIISKESAEEPQETQKKKPETESSFFISSDDSVNVNMYSKTVYNFNNDTYYYLDSEDNANTLQKNIQTLISKDEKIYRIKLCLFKIIDECKEPFLQFLLEKTDDTMTFSTFEISSNELNNGEPSDIFITQCVKYINEIVNNQRVTLGSDIIKRCFRGFVEEPENTIYAIFDCTYLNIDINAQRFWGILDEIVNEKYIYKTPIDKDIYTMIQNNEFLAYIKDKNGERINMPCCLYLCKINDNGEYDNIYYDTDEHNMKHKSPVDGKISHEVFGHFYYFTTDPIHNDINVNRLKRFSVFIDNALYVLNINKPIEEIDFISDDEDDFDETYKSYRDYTCIYFFEDGLQLWCVKSLSRFIEL
jgi:hypothetical protein